MPSEGRPRRGDVRRVVCETRPSPGPSGQTATSIKEFGPTGPPIRGEESSWQWDQGLRLRRGLTESAPGISAIWPAPKHLQLHGRSGQASCDRNQRCTRSGELPITS